MFCCDRCSKDPRWPEHHLHSNGAVSKMRQAVPTRAFASTQYVRVVLSQPQTQQVARISPSALPSPSVSHQIAMQTLRQASPSSLSSSSRSSTSSIDTSRGSTPSSRTTPSPTSLSQQSPVQLPSRDTLVAAQAWRKIIEPLHKAWVGFCNNKEINPVGQAPFFKIDAQNKLWIMYSTFLGERLSGKTLSEIDAKVHPPASGSELAKSALQKIHIELYAPGKHSLPTL